MEGYEDYLATSIIKEREYKRGVEAGYKKKEAELEIEREKEIDGIWDQHRKEEELEVEVELTN